MFDFENPTAFLFLLLIPILHILRFLKIFSRISFPLTLSDWEGSDFNWNSRARRFADVTIKIFLNLFYICLVISYADPVRHKQQKVYSSRGASIMFVLDVSPSMAARDIGEGTRLDAAKNAVHFLASNNGGIETGLVEMAQNAAAVVPPTMDRNVFFRKLNELRIGELGDGTAIGTGLSSAIYHLEKSTAPRKAIVLITDGENNSGSVHPVTAARLAAQKNISLYILGIGTKGMVALEYTDPNTGKVLSGYLDSKFDSQTLSKIASEGNGKFFETESTGALSQAISAIAKNETVIQSYHIKKQDTRLYPCFLMAALILFVTAWFLRRIVLKEIL